MSAAGRGVTAALAEFTADLTFADLPDRAVGMARDAIVDALGVGVLGAGEETVDRICRALDADGDAGEAFVLGGGPGRSRSGAALHNGTAIHALDYDDTAHPAYAHPSACIVPVLLALGWERSGPELLTAYVVGIEILGSLGRALNMTHYERGWHATGTLGTIAAAGAAAKVLDLDRAGTTLALGIAASSASGLRAGFGTMTKPLHAGLAARSGVLAAQLAREGFTASSTAMEGQRGFLRVFAGSERARTEVFDTLGQPLEILRAHALALKPFPACGATHPAIEASLALAREIGGAEVGRVDVGVNRWTPDILVHTAPRLPLEGKFSMEHCVAVALGSGALGVESFTEPVLADPSVDALRRRVDVTVDDRVREDPEFATIVTVTLRDGRRFEHRVDLAEGKPERWFSRERLREKFLDCTRGTLGDERAASAFTALVELPQASAFADPAVLLHPPGDGARSQGAA